ncbi:hypothetical protein, partial [Klebsiella pneumoniae]|uniref:hypothetical protein n=1 Tax=Klebsiella pneumoniae TaxID=573 RepID=UPI001BAA410A
EVKRRSADGSVGSPHVRVGNCQASNKAESPVERPGFLFLRLKRTPSRKVRGFLLCGVYLPRWRCAYRGYKSVARQSAQHRLRRKLRHVRSIISFQRKIKPRHGNPFAIIHFFPAPALAMIAKTVLAKKNVNPITYKNITII